MILPIEIKWLCLNIKIIIVEDIKCTNKLLLQIHYTMWKTSFIENLQKINIKKQQDDEVAYTDEVFLGRGSIFSIVFIGTFKQLFCFVYFTVNDYT